MKHGTPTYAAVTHIINILLSVLPVHYKCQSLFYSNIYGNLISSKILKTGDIRLPTKVY